MNVMKMVFQHSAILFYYANDRQRHNLGRALHPSMRYNFCKHALIIVFSTVLQLEPVYFAITTSRHPSYLTAVWALPTNIVVGSFIGAHQTQSTPSNKTTSKRPLNFLAIQCHPRSFGHHRFIKTRAKLLPHPSLRFFSLIKASNAQATSCVPGTPRTENIGGRNKLEKFNADHDYLAVSTNPL